jgi:hypothetical protein
MTEYGLAWWSPESWAAGADPELEPLRTEPEAGPDADPLTEMGPDGVPLADYQASMAAMERWLDPEPEAGG